jgi:hypothetical protein
LAANVKAISFWAMQTMPLISIAFIRTIALGSVLVGPMAALVLAADSGPWPTEKAWAWQRQHGWLVGCNFIPSTAINQLEMWQAETFDLPTIDRELGWAAQLGFNSLRVFLHHLPFDQDASSFLQRIDQFLATADKHGLGVMFVLFDSCWDPFPKPGPQRAPRPHVHNSGWVQCPGRDILVDPARHEGLKPFVQEVMRRFGADRRVHAWDLFNEPDNCNDSSYGQHEPPNKAELGLALLKKAYAWARQVNPTQPLTVGVWKGNWADPAKLSPLERLCLEQSDVISFHNYGPLEALRACVQHLRRYQRPILCTEYMARPAGSRFDPHLRYLKEQAVAAYNWGLVEGKTQTIYPWDSWKKAYTAPPPVWFHDIFRRDGTAFDPEEVAFIKRLTGKTN